MHHWLRLTTGAWKRFSILLLAVMCSVVGAGSGAAGEERTTPGTTVKPPRQGNAFERLLAEAFESGMRDAMFEAERRRRADFEQEMRRLAAIESTSVEQFDAAWKIDLDVERRPAREVLDPLLSEMGLRLSDDSSWNSVLKRPVSLTYRGGSRLQAVEEICDQIGVHPDYSTELELDGGAIFGGMMRLLLPLGGLAKPAGRKLPASAVPAVTLVAGRRPFPLVFAGPFAVEIIRLDEYPPYGTGKLDLRVLAAGVPPSVSGYWQQTRWSGLAITAVVDQAGRDLLAGDSDVITWRGKPVLPSSEVQKDLRNLLRHVRSIRISGRVTASVPVIVETLRFDQLAAGAIQQGQEIRVRLDRIQPQPSGGCSLAVTVTGKTDLPLELIALDAERKPIEVTSHFSGGAYYRVHGPNGQATDTPSECQGSYSLEGHPQSLIFKAFGAVDSFDYLVELVANLESSAQQPVAPTELRFPGTEPLQVAVLRISGEGPFQKLQLRVTNASNKDIRYARCTLNYADQAGRIAEDHSTSLSAPLGQTQGLPLLVASNSATELEQTAFFAPDNLASATVRVNRVVFADGSTWTPAPLK